MCTIFQVLDRSTQLPSIAIKDCEHTNLDTACYEGLVYIGSVAAPAPKNIALICSPGNGGVIG